MRLLTFVALLLTATFTYAQDNIVLRNGEEIPAKVLEVSQTDLKYRKFANPEGPVYTAPLRDVLLIKYANGSKDSFGTNNGPLLNKPTLLGNGVAPALPSAVSTLDHLRYKGGAVRSLLHDQRTAPR